MVSVRPSSECRPSACPLTEYLASLEGPAHSDAASAERFDAFWNALRGLLRDELRRRGLWLAPPRFVGLVAAGDRFGREALDELTADAYVHLMERARTLCRHVEAKGRVDGLLRLELRHFLQERQRRADPLGYRLYGIVREAVDAAIERGSLRQLRSDDGRSVLAASAASRAATRHADLVGESAPAARVEAVTRRWADDLLPDLVTGWGKRRAAMVDAVSRRCGRLGRSGVPVTTFDELLDGLRRAVRVRWRAVLTDDPTPTHRGDVPGGSFERRQSYDALIACVSEAVARGDGLPRRRREHLQRLWRFVRLQAPALPDDQMPSRRRLAALLGIPRSTLPGLYETLGELVERCRGGES